MELSKIKNKIMSINYVLIVLLSYVIRCLINGASYQDTIIIAVLAIFVGFIFYTKEFFRIKEKVISENDFRDAVNKDMVEIKNKLANVQLALNGNILTRK